MDALLHIVQNMKICKRSSRPKCENWMYCVGTLQVAENIYNEFFEQGDLEKAELKINPIDMMNRDKKDQLPSMQVGFIDSICMPVYQVGGANI